ncbi:MAG TPA: multicopper oxidase domain-containing protein [Conexibacter sp.]|nr:multicopper oxidase domain-containing protein [Conexibacter sp.]
MRTSCSLGCLAALLVVAFASLLPPTALATSGGSPYATPDVVDVNPAPDVVETTLVAKESTVDIGSGVLAHAQTFNGAIPGPTFRLKVSDTVLVHYRNELARPSGIHWHGIEVPNGMDGTPFTQDQIPPGEDFLYRFKVTRPGVFGYHPDHPGATNQVFKGLSGTLIVDDPDDAALQASGTLPPAAQTLPIVVSDTTVCKAPGSNDAATYAPSLPWVGGGLLLAQPPPTPLSLCETTPIDEDGNARGPFAAGDIPNIKTAASSGRTNEGQTVLTNGVNVGGRAGSPSAPGALAPGASTLSVQAGQGLRLKLLNAAAVRYARLRLTTSTGALVPLVRVGGEGGLLDNAVVEGGIAGGFDTLYGLGEILLPPGARADVVAAIPPSATGVLTLWTQDYLRTGLGYANIPTVPVMHLSVSGNATPPYAISGGTPLRAATGHLVEALPAATGTLLNPSLFAPPKLGLVSQDIRLTQTGVSLGINDVLGSYGAPGAFPNVPHLGSTRYAKVGDTLELTATNTTSGHQPFHLHGFSFQPLDLTRSANPTYTWPYKEFRDTVNIPARYTLRFRVRLDDRALADGTTSGGALGRWAMHSGIFFIAANGMLSELVVVASASGNERPDIAADTTGVQVASGATATMTGTFADPDGDDVVLSASVGTVTENAGGTWSWTYPTGVDTSRTVYVTAQDPGGLRAQTAFDLRIDGAPGTVVTPPGVAPGVPPAGSSPRRVHVRVRWRATKKSSKLLSIRLRDVPARSRLVLRCKGRGCPRKAATLRRFKAPLGRTVVRGRALEPYAKLRPRARLDIVVLTDGATGSVARYVVRGPTRRGRPQAPKLTRLCLPPGAKRPRRC